MWSRRMGSRLRKTFVTADPVYVFAGPTDSQTTKNSHWTMWQGTVPACCDTSVSARWPRCHECRMARARGIQLIRCSALCPVYSICEMRVRVCSGSGAVTENKASGCARMSHNDVLVHTDRLSKTSTRILRSATAEICSGRAPVLDCADGTLSADAFLLSYMP